MAVGSVQRAQPQHHHRQPSPRKFQRQLFADGFGFGVIIRTIGGARRGLGDGGVARLRPHHNDGADVDKLFYPGCLRCPQHVLRALNIGADKWLRRPPQPKIGRSVDNVPAALRRGPHRSGVGDVTGGKFNAQFAQKSRVAGGAYQRAQRAALRRQMLAQVAA
ncbi:MAG: hypothetical protein FOGNACKC_04245 [Anaerolineae bacterium]|nr:hypothetical protein [Anaerolineae bacterium]